MGCLCESKNELKNIAEQNTKKDLPTNCDSNKNNFSKTNSKTNTKANSKTNSKTTQINNKINSKNPPLPKESNSSKKDEKKKLEKYEIKYNQLIGKGGFGKVYLATEKISNKNLAIKIEQENTKNNFSYLLNEFKIYQKLKGYNHIPKIYDCFKIDNKNYLVMEILGSSLDSIFKKYNKKFSLTTILNIGLQIIDILEYIHSKNIIHRDLKPDCFLVGNINKAKINIIDFGFASNFIDPKLGLPYPLKTDSFVGNYKFTSFNSIVFGYNKSRRDDIESLAYILIYFLKGSLPWENKKDKTEIQNIRRQISIDMLCTDIPLEIKSFLSYSWKLKFFEKPDYNYLRNLLNKCAEHNKLLLSKNNYDWVIDENISLLETKTFVTLTNQEFDNVSSLVNSCINRNDKQIIEANYIKIINLLK